MTKILFLIAQENFQDTEFKVPKRVLENEGKRVLVAAETTKIATGMFGQRVKPDMTFSEALRRISEFRAVAVIGGSGVVTLIKNPYAIQILQRADREKKIIAAICWGPRVLANAGVLSGKRATVNCDGPDSNVGQELLAARATWSKEKIAIDGRIITAFSRDYAEDFGRAISEKLSKQLY